MGYIRAGLGNNGQGIVVPITPEMKSPRMGLGYDIFVASLPTHGLATTMEVLFCAGGIQTGFLKEQPIVYGVEHIDELPIPHMP
jgi:hypothetical protein